MVDFTKRIHIETGLTRKTLLHNIPSALKGVDKLPSGKELEQLPMTNTLPGMGENRGPFEKESLSSFVEEVRPQPSKSGEQKRNNPV
jgi:hypothetical protein